MQRKEIFVGVDVSKETLDIAIQGTRNHIRVINGAEGFKQMQAWFKSLGIDLGMCWFPLAQASRLCPSDFGVSPPRLGFIFCLHSGGSLP